MADKRRVAMVEIETVDSSASHGALPAIVTRYQFDNHLGSAVLELDKDAAVIRKMRDAGDSYEQIGNELGRSKSDIYRVCMTLGCMSDT